MAGLETTGFARKTLEEILDEIEADQLSDLDPSLNVRADGLLGVLNGIFAAAVAEAWEVLEEVYRSQYRDSAEGEALDNVGDLIGVGRLLAAASTARQTLVGTNGTLVDAGSVVSDAGNSDARFATDADATITTAAAWATSTSYAVEDLVANGGNLYQATTPGTSASGGGGPAGTGSSISDGSVVWAFVAAGSAAVVVGVTAEETGPTVANAGTLTVIETPVGGWTSTVNVQDATVGRDDETDPAYRDRQTLSLRALGSSTVDGITGRVLEVEGVTEVRVFENVTAVTDADGVPPHAFETVVLGGTDQAVADAIWDAKAAGILAHGTTTVEVEDSQGEPHDVGLTRPTGVPIHLEVELDADEDTYAGDAAVQAALAAFGDDSLGIGADVVRSKLYDVIFGVAGVRDVTVLLLDTVTPPTGTTNITIGSRQLATIDTANVTVTSTLV